MVSLKLIAGVLALVLCAWLIWREFAHAPQVIHCACGRTFLPRGHGKRRQRQNAVDNGWRHFDRRWICLDCWNDLQSGR